MLIMQPLEQETSVVVAVAVAVWLTEHPVIVEYRVLHIEDVPLVASVQDT